MASDKDLVSKRTLEVATGNEIDSHKHEAAAALPPTAVPHPAEPEQPMPLARIAENISQAAPDRASVRFMEPVVPAPPPPRRLVEEDPPQVTQSAIHRTVMNAFRASGDIDLCFDGDGYQRGFCEQDYVHEIHAYLSNHEKSLNIINPFRDPEIKTSLDARARAKLVDWISGMHYTNNLAAESFYLAIQMVDRLFSLCADEISRDRLELIGITVLFTASKFEESYTPGLGHFLNSVRNRYSRHQVAKLEFVILKKLNMNLSYPTAITFIRRYAACLMMRNKDRYRAFCLAELCLHNEEFITILPSQLAAATCIASLKLAGVPEGEEWPSDLEYYSMHTANEMAPIVDMVLKVAENCDKDIYKYSISKYSKSQYYEVALELLKYSEWASMSKK